MGRAVPGGAAGSCRARRASPQQARSRCSLTAAALQPAAVGSGPRVPSWHNMTLCHVLCWAAVRFLGKFGCPGLSVCAVLCADSTGPAAGYVLLQEPPGCSPGQALCVHLGLPVPLQRPLYFQPMWIPSVCSGNLMVWSDCRCKKAERSVVHFIGLGGSIPGALVSPCVCCEAALGA